MLSKVLHLMGFVGFGDLISERDNGRPLAGAASSNLLLEMLLEIVRTFRRGAGAVTRSRAHGWFLS